MLQQSSPESTTVSGTVWPPARLGSPEYVAWFQGVDWASTPIGPTCTWPDQLRKTCELILGNPEPATIFWGPDVILIYNEAYISVAGGKHPAMMGRSARFQWAEVWDAYEPLFQQMRVDGKAFKQTKNPLLLHRNGFWEETFFDVLVTPLFSDDGLVSGHYCALAEVTKQVLAERRIHTLLELSQKASTATSRTDLWKISLEVLSEHANIDFLALYTLRRPPSQVAVLWYDLEGSVGAKAGEFPSKFNVADLDEQSPLYWLRHACKSRTAVVASVDDGTMPASMLHGLEDATAEAIPHTRVAYPLGSTSDEEVTALLVIGIHPRRPYDADYQAFSNIFVRQIEGAITSLAAFEKEKERLTQQFLYESERKFKRFAENAQVGIFSFDPAGNITFCNNAWLELSGHDRENAYAMSWTNDVHPDCVDDTKHYWNDFLNLKGPRTFEVQYRKPWIRNNGTGLVSLDRTYVVASVYPEIDESGRLIGIIGCVTDISGLKWADRLQSQRLNEALEHKRQQENFLDITSHEMRNPLNAILHCAIELTELLPELKEDSSTVRHAAHLKDCLEAARTILYCGRHQKRIIDDVLTLSKLDSNMLSITPVETRPIDIVEEVLALFDTELRASGIKANMIVLKSYNALNLQAILVDSHRLIQILINLVANAIKFTKGESLRELRVEIGASSTEPLSSPSGVRFVPSGRYLVDPTEQPDWGVGQCIFLHFTVRDTGPGMTREEADLLFQRFAQASPRTHVQYGGSGLGLFISRELAELHGGRIGISSEVGHGSTFEFYVKGRRPTNPMPLPAHNVANHHPGASLSTNNPSPELSRTSAIHIEPRSSSLHILVVEDNLVNQKILARLLRKHGYQVSVANHGKEALAMIHTSAWRHKAPDQASVEPILKIDVVLADIEMPIMDGKEFVRLIRQQQREGSLVAAIPVVAVTGNARNEQVQNARDCGFDEVIRKPYQIEEILSVVETHARGSRITVQRQLSLR